MDCRGTNTEVEKDIATLQARAHSGLDQSCGGVGGKMWLVLGCYGIKNDKTQITAC